MHLLLWAEDSRQKLELELCLAFGAVQTNCASGVLQADFQIEPGRKLPYLAFCRQLLPNASPVSAESISAWAELIAERAIKELPEGRPWMLHVATQYFAASDHRMGARAWHSLSRKGEMPERRASTGVKAHARNAGRHRCELVHAAVLDRLDKRRRHLRRSLCLPGTPWSSEHSLVQALLLKPDSGFLSVATAPLPFEQHHLIGSFPKGEISIESDPRAPSRAFTKLAEAQARMGHYFQAGELCIDLGASPGSWTYLAVKSGARVIAVDRAPLREDLMRSPKVEFRMADAWQFRPPRIAEWLLCDVIACAEDVSELLLRWLRQGWCKWFVVTLKLKDASSVTALERVKAELPPLTSQLFVARLCSNKKEVTVFGCRKELSS